MLNTTFVVNEITGFFYFQNYKGGKRVQWRTILDTFAIIQGFLKQSPTERQQFSITLQTSKKRTPTTYKTNRVCYQLKILNVYDKSLP